MVIGDEDAMHTVDSLEELGGDVLDVLEFEQDAADQGQADGPDNEEEED